MEYALGEEHTILKQRVEVGLNPYSTGIGSRSDHSKDYQAACVLS